MVINVMVTSLDDIVNRFTSGYTKAEIAGELGLSKPAITQRLNRAGIKTQEDGLEWLGKNGRIAKITQQPVKPAAVIKTKEIHSMPDDGDILACAEAILGQAEPTELAKYSAECRRAAVILAKEMGNARKLAAEAASKRPQEGLPWADIQVLMQRYHEYVASCGVKKYEGFHDFLTEVVQGFNRLVAEEYPEAERYL